MIWMITLTPTDDRRSGVISGRLYVSAWADFCSSAIRESPEQGLSKASIVFFTAAEYQHKNANSECNSII